MIHRERDGTLYIIERNIERIWRDHMFARRQERAARWACVLVIGLLLGLLAGLLL
jgi:hypothetical protein